MAVIRAEPGLQTNKWPQTIVIRGVGDR